MFAVFHESDVAGQYPVELLVRERRVLLVNPTVAFALAFQLDHPVAVVVDADAVFFTCQHAVHFFLVGGVPVIVEIQAADCIAAVTGMAVMVEQWCHAHVQVGLLTVRNQIFELVTVTFLAAAWRHGKLLADTPPDAPPDSPQQRRRGLITAHCRPPRPGRT